MCAKTSNHEQLENAVFIGNGSAEFRAQKTEFASPFIAGRHGSPLECQIKYAEYLANHTELLRSLAKLEGKAVACGCALNLPRHGDVLLAWAPAVSRAGANRNNLWRRPPLRIAKYPTAMLIAADLVKVGAERCNRLGHCSCLVESRTNPMAKVGAEGCNRLGLCSCLAESRTSPMVQFLLRFPQHAVDRAFRKLFPEEFTKGRAFPNLEDLVNFEPFATYPDFVDERLLDSQVQLGPQFMKNVGRGTRTAVVSDQKGALFSKGAVQQLVSLGLTPDLHFEEACRVAAEEEFPMNVTPPVSLDLRCAADAVARNVSNLHGIRGSWYKFIKKLAMRMQIVSDHWRKFQTGNAAAIAGKIHIALVAVAVVLLAWPHAKLPMAFMVGFRTSGAMEMRGV